ncbi:MAG TPA: aminoglycoside phosphotransferase family protein [Gemmataceae bacterium]|nr:aminoglycoside phosphotransferase family protein [Gemmataceae bacterium]
MTNSPREAHTGDLTATLAALLDRHLGRPVRVAGIERQRSAYSSSFALDELEVRLEDGTAVSLVLKDLSRSAILEGARRARPAFRYDPLREVRTYRDLLAPARLGTPAYYGSVADPAAGRYWLFLERVQGVRLNEVGDFAVWEEVARWLARLHVAFASRAERLAHEGWPRHGGEFYRVWADRAGEFTRVADPPLSPGTVRRLRRLVASYDRVVGRLLALPVTLIHDEFYPSNVLIGQRDGRLRVCPVDWETAAVGPGLIDLAALTAGDWTDGQRRVLVRAYLEALPHGPGGSEDEVLTGLDYCRLHSAVQWAGWSTDWSPPPECARDWLEDALTLAESLGLC